MMSFWVVPWSARSGDALLLGRDDVERQQPRRRRVDRHRRVHLVERDAVQQRRHVAAVARPARRPCRPRRARARGRRRSRSASAGRTLRRARSGPWPGCAGRAHWTWRPWSAPRTSASSTAGRARAAGASCPNCIDSRVNSATSARVDRTDGNSASMRAIDVRHKGREKVICCWEVDGVLIDPGPGITEETLLAALGGLRAARAPAHPHPLRPRGRDRRAASAAGRTCRSTCTSAARRTWPTRRKLLASAGRLYGGDEGLLALWGECVPGARGEPARALGGETTSRGFRVEYTPGHASHHVCYFHEPSGWAFVGDVGGARIPPHAFTVAPTPPPDIDVAAWERSIATIRAWEPARLGADALRRRPRTRSSSTRCLEALHAQVELEGSSTTRRASSPRWRSASARRCGADARR